MDRSLRAAGVGTAVAAIVVVGGASPAAAAGEPDPAFSSDGKVITDVFGDMYDYLNDVAVQADGKIVAVGSWGGNNSHWCRFGAVRCNFVLVRYLPNGSIDTAFGSNGRVMTDFDGSDDIAWAVAVQPDGRIVAAGSAVVGTHAPDFALARYLPDGSLDRSFSGDGKATTSLGDEEQAYDVLIQPNGSILAVGYTNTQGTDDFALVRYFPNGTPDPSFSNDGIQRTGLGHDDVAEAAALRSDGKIVVVGDRWEDDEDCFACRESDLAFATYNPDGSLDSTFDGDGKMTDGLGGSEGLDAVTTMSDGRFVVAGHSSKKFFAARYLASGRLDESFALKGRKWVDFGAGARAGASGVAVASDGKIVLTGSAFGDLAAARVTASGANDLTFSGDGMVRTDFGRTEYGAGMVLQPDGKILVAGPRTHSTEDTDFVLVRYLP